MQHKKSILSRLLEEDKIIKLAQELGMQEDINSETADKLANEVFDQIFNELTEDLENL